MSSLKLTLEDQTLKPMYINEVNDKKDVLYKCISVRIQLHNLYTIRIEKHVCVYLKIYMHERKTYTTFSGSRQKIDIAVFGSRCIALMES